MCGKRGKQKGRTGGKYEEWNYLKAWGILQDESLVSGRGQTFGSQPELHMNTIFMPGVTEIHSITLAEDRRAASDEAWNSQGWRSWGTASHSQLEKKGMIPRWFNLFLLWCAALLFLGVTAPCNMSFVFCLFCCSLDRLQGLDLQLCKLQWHHWL